MTRWRYTCSALLSAFVMAGTLQTSATANVLVPAQPPSFGFVQVVGAVQTPGSILLRQPGLSLAEAIRQVGGTDPDAYLLGTVLLRKSRGGTQSIAGIANRRCLGLPELQALQALQTAVPSDQRREFTASMYSRELMRIPVRLDASELRTGRTPAVSLMDGDVLIIPPRPAYVQVTHASGRDDSVLYQPGLLAEEYFQSAGYSRRGMFSKDWAVLPNGEIRELSLRFWNYQPTAIPPGTVLLSAIEDPQACVVTDRVGL